MGEETLLKKFTKFTNKIVLSDSIGCENFEIIRARAKVDFGLDFKKIYCLRISLEEISYYFQKMQPSIKECLKNFIVMIVQIFVST